MIKQKSPNATILILLIGLLQGRFAEAYIIPTRTILQKTAENSGSGAFSIEQQVEFQSGSAESVFLKETWIIENSNTMRLTVRGDRNIQNSQAFKLQQLYSNGQKWRLIQKARESIKTPSEFMQRFFHFKQSESLGSTLIREKILPPKALAKKTLPKNSADIVFEPESWVRLSRVGGNISYALGTPSVGTDYSPGIWIEQDQFVIRKLRLATSEEKSRGEKYIELVAENYREYSKGLFYPEKQTIRWGNNTVNIKTLAVKSISAKGLQSLQPSGLDVQTQLDAYQAMSNFSVVEEFYSRFH